MQRLLRRADWDVDGVRDDVRDYAIEQLGERDGVNPPQRGGCGGVNAGEATSTWARRPVAADVHHRRGGC